MISGPVVVVAAWREDLFRTDVNTRILRDKNQVRTETQPGERLAAQSYFASLRDLAPSNRSEAMHKLQPCNFSSYRAYFPILCRLRFGPSFEKAGLDGQ